MDIDKIIDDVERYLAQFILYLVSFFRARRPSEPDAPPAIENNVVIFSMLSAVLGAYITARLILFATAWAATSKEILEAAPIEPPTGAVITPRVQVRDGLGPAGALTAMAVGAVGALGLSRFARRR